MHDSTLSDSLVQHVHNQHFQLYIFHNHQHTDSFATHTHTPSYTTGTTIHISHIYTSDSVVAVVKALRCNVRVVCACIAVFIVACFIGFGEVLFGGSLSASLHNYI